MINTKARNLKRPKKAQCRRSVLVKLRWIRHMDGRRKGAISVQRSFHLSFVPTPVPTTIESSLTLKLSGRESLLALSVSTSIHCHFLNCRSSAIKRYGIGNRRIHCPSAVTPAVQEASTLLADGV